MHGQAANKKQRYCEAFWQCESSKHGVIFVIDINFLLDQEQCLKVDSNRSRVAGSDFSMGGTSGFVFF